MITHIYFDWSGTLARRGMKERFARSRSASDAAAVLYSDVIEVLSELRRRGYVIGIISNCSVAATEMKAGIRRAGIAKYFNGGVIFEDGSQFCRKPCREIFAAALQMDGSKPEQALMIGNKREPDVVGAKGAGMHALLVDRLKPTDYGRGRVHSLIQILDAPILAYK